MASSSVPKLYYSVIEDVISNIREAFIDEGVDEQALTELKQVWEKKLQESKAIERAEPVTSRAQTNLQPVQQTTSLGSSAATITHQLAMPSGNLVPQTLLQFPAGSNDLQKTMQLNIPQKLTLTMPAHLAQTGLQTLVSAPGTAVQIPPELASLFQGNVITSGHPNAIQHGGQQLTNIYQALTADQLKNAQQFTITVPVTTQQQTQLCGPGKGAQTYKPGSEEAPASSIGAMRKVWGEGYNFFQNVVVNQVDGTEDTSDDEDDDDFQDNEDDRDNDDDEQNEDDMGEEDEEPLNSDDDVSEDDPTDLFDTENVVVCQYDKITRSKNRWKFHLKDGIMNLQGKDFVFQKALGDSEW